MHVVMKPILTGMEAYVGLERSGHRCLAQNLLWASRYVVLFCVRSGDPFCQTADRPRQPGTIYTTLPPERESFDLDPSTNQKTNIIFRQACIRILFRVKKVTESYRGSEGLANNAENLRSLRGRLATLTSSVRKPHFL